MPKRKSSPLQELTLPAYRLLAKARPVFHLSTVSPIYPYTLQDEISSQPAETTYRTLGWRTATSG
jgi:hypothetical protein